MDKISFFDSSIPLWVFWLAISFNKQEKIQKNCNFLLNYQSVRKFFEKHGIETNGN